jgi:hypothetical protein
MYCDGWHGLQLQTEPNRSLISVRSDVRTSNPWQFWDKIESETPTRKRERFFFRADCICPLFCVSNLRATLHPGCGREMRMEMWDIRYVLCYQNARSKRSWFGCNILLEPKLLVEISATIPPSLALGKRDRSTWPGLFLVALKRKHDAQFCAVR